MNKRFVILNKECRLGKDRVGFIVMLVNPGLDIKIVWPDNATPAPVCDATNDAQRSTADNKKI